jgi:quercetin dioxygenase-like cupin family protein
MATWSKAVDDITLYARLQQTELSLVSGRGAADGGRTQSDYAKCIRSANRKLVAVTCLVLSLFASPALHAETDAANTEVSPTASGQRSQIITITRNGSQPSSQASAQHFTGSVRIEPLFDAHDPSRATGGRVTFEPGARTAWHMHPLGQTLIVTAGTGWIQQEGGLVEEIRAGDVVWIPPATKHWHGATPTTTMTHMAIQEQLNGKNVEWMEQVSDEHYRK